MNPVKDKHEYDNNFPIDLIFGMMIGFGGQYGTFV